MEMGLLDREYMGGARRVPRAHVGEETLPTWASVDAPPPRARRRRSGLTAERYIALIVVIVVLAMMVTAILIAHGL